MDEGKWRTPHGYVPPDAEQMTKNENNHIDEHNKRKQEDLDMCRRSSEVIDNEGNTNNKATYKSAASILSFRRH